MSPKIHVAILEDHPITTQGYLYQLKDLPQFEVVGAAKFGVELEPLLTKCAVDLVILDVNVPTAPDNPNPYPILHVIPELLQKHPNLSVLVISMLTERALIQAVLDSGASGYILKDDSVAAQQLGSILVSVMSGGIYLSEQVRQKLFKYQSKDRGSALPPRQLEALSLCAAYPDDSLADLAVKLHVANSTFRNLLSNVYIKLEVSHRAAAVAKARQLGLITPTEMPKVHSQDSDA